MWMSWAPWTRGNVIFHTHSNFRYASDPKVQRAEDSKKYQQGAKSSTNIRNILSRWGLVLLSSAFATSHEINATWSFCWAYSHFSLGLCQSDRKKTHLRELSLTAHLLSRQFCSSKRKRARWRRSKATAAVSAECRSSRLRPGKPRMEQKWKRREAHCELRKNRKPDGSFACCSTDSGDKVQENGNHLLIIN